MKKTIIISIIALFAIVGVVSAYEVQYGDTLSKIAQNAGMSLQELLNNNPQVENPDLIHPGNQINTGSHITFFDKLGEGTFGAINFVQVQDMYLSGSGIALTATSITLDDFSYPNEQKVQMVDFGGKGFGTLEPDTSREENISFTGITQAASGKATLTGVSRGLSMYTPYTASTTLRFAHAGGTLFRITNSAPFYNELLAKSNDETITGLVTYNRHPVFMNGTDNPTTSTQYAPKFYVDTVVNQGAATSTEDVGGISELATQTEMASSTPWGVLDPHVIQSKYASSTPMTFTGNGNMFVIVSEDDGKLAQGWLDLTETWTWTGLLTWGKATGSSATTSDYFMVGDGSPTFDYLNGDMFVRDDVEIGGNATSSAALHAIELCIEDNCMSNFVEYNTTTAATSTGAGSETLIGFATSTIPANSMGSLGMIKVTGWGVTVNADVGLDELRVRFGGVDACIYDFKQVAESVKFECYIVSNNNTSKQKSRGSMNFATTTAISVIKYPNVDTTVDEDVVLHWTGTNAGDSFALEMWDVQLIDN